MQTTEQLPAEETQKKDEEEKIAMDNTKIEWCDSTWNPVTGCLHNCEYCYAQKIANRFEGYDKITLPDISISKGRNVLEEPAVKNGKAAPYPFGFKPTFHKYLLDKPQRWKKSRTVFVCSMADLFGKWVPDEWIDQVFEACEKAPQHRYLFLTKNVKRYTDYGVPIADNMWYGISVTKESQMSDFNSLPAGCNTFISFEPLLEDLHVDKHNIMFYQVNWFIIGAETGNKKDKVIPKKEWVDSIVALADECHKPVFMKDSLVSVMGKENMRREFPWAEC